MDTDENRYLSVFICVHLWFFFKKLTFARVLIFSKRYICLLHSWEKTKMEISAIFCKKIAGSDSQFISLNIYIRCSLNKDDIYYPSLRFHLLTKRSVQLLLKLIWKVRQNHNHLPSQTQFYELFPDNIV